MVGLSCAVARPHHLDAKELLAFPWQWCISRSAPEFISASAIISCVSELFHFPVLRERDPLPCNL